MTTLWDLLLEEQRTAPGAARPPREARSAPVSRYARMERAMLELHRVRVRKWRSSTTGVAWQVFYRDGAVSRLIESPRPRGPVSAAVFLHEIGHHAIGFDRYKVRCVEEYHAWRFALGELARWEIPITDRVRARVRDSLKYAIEKATRRGLRVLPTEVLGCIEEQDRILRAPGGLAPQGGTGHDGAGSRQCLASEERCCAEE